IAQTTNLKAQNDRQTRYSLARQAAANEEFEKAIAYYEELFAERQSSAYYRELIQLYPKVDNFKAAEKLIKKQIRRKPARLDYLADLGHIYALQDEDNKARKSFEEAIEKLGAKKQDARLLANKFNQYEAFEYAE